MNKGKSVAGHGSVLLVVINDGNVVLDSVDPTEDDSPLLIDAYAPKSLEIALQRLQPVCWRNPKILQVSGLINHTKFPACSMLDVTGKSSRPRPFEYFAGFRVSEGLDHHRGYAGGAVTSSVITARVTIDNFL